MTLKQKSGKTNGSLPRKHLLVSCKERGLSAISQGPFVGSFYLIITPSKDSLSKISLYLETMQACSFGSTKDWGKLCPSVSPVRFKKKKLFILTGPYFMSKKNHRRAQNILPEASPQSGTTPPATDPHHHPHSRKVSETLQSWGSVE